MNGYRIPLLTKIAIGLAERQHPGIERWVRDGIGDALDQVSWFDENDDVENEMTLYKLRGEDMCFDFRLRTIGACGTHVIAKVWNEARTWVVTPGEMILRGLPETLRIGLLETGKGTLDGCGVMADDPWSGMAFTDVRREEASPGANGQGIVLTIPDLSNDNTDGATWDHQE